MKYAELNKKTPNVGAGKNLRQGVLLHHTDGSYAGAVAWLCNPASQVSAHVVIAKSGERTVLGPDDAVLWHAGNSIWKGRKWCNSFTLGVEFEGNTNVEPLTEAQVESFLEWFLPRAKKYGWTADTVTDHRTVSLDGKVDLKPTELERCLNAIRKSLAVC